MLHNNTFLNLGSTESKTLNRAFNNLITQIINNLTEEYNELGCDCNEHNIGYHSLTKQAELMVCDDCISHYTCACGCEEILICRDEQDYFECEECEDKFANGCIDGNIYWCQLCEGGSCNSCKDFFKIKENNSYNFACSDCVQAL